MFAVLDVETTGLRPGGSDRIIEVAVVRLGDDREVIDEWTTLVDPGRPVRGGQIHGIYNQNVRGSPVFAEIAGDIADRLGNNVVVAHNARFDAAFVEAEFRRLGADVGCEWLCTLQLVGRLGFNSTRSLRACCENLGVAHDEGHAALVDARATARLLVLLLAAAYDREVTVPLPPLSDDPAFPR
ncbi:MAG: 3'-5' exonuclease [Actinomycetota bacterium]|nr:3'-5' exonuclease [Actinomycetota bacterium]